jgi:hypothetical protein
VLRPLLRPSAGPGGFPGGLQLGLQLGDGGQTATQVGGQRFDQADDVAGDAHGLGDVAECVLGDGLVAGLAQDQANGRLIGSVALEVIDGGEVEVHLAGELRLQGPDLEVDDQEAPQFQMVKQQVDVKILAADFEVDVFADESEADSALQQELADVSEQAALYLALVDIVGQPEEINRGVGGTGGGDIQESRMSPGVRMSPRVHAVPDDVEEPALPAGRAECLGDGPWAGAMPCWSP